MLTAALHMTPLNSGYALAPQAVHDNLLFSQQINQLYSLKIQGVPLQNILNQLRKNYPQYQTDKKQEEAMIYQIWLLLDKIPRGEGNSIKQILENSGINCFGFATLAGFIFQDLGFLTHWANVIDNAYLIPENHVCILLKFQTSDTFVIFDPALKILTPIPTTNDSAIIPKRKIESGKNILLVLHSLSQEEKINLEKQRSINPRSFTTIRKEHPSMQLINFDEGFDTATALVKIDQLRLEINKKYSFQFEQEYSNLLETTFKKSSYNIQVISLYIDYLISKKQYSEAIQELKPIIEKFPEHPILLDLLGRVYSLNNEQEKGLEAFQKAFPFVNSLKFNYSQVIAYNLAKAYYDLGYLDDSYIVLQKILEVVPQNFKNPFFVQCDSLSDQVNRRRGTSWAVQKPSRIQKDPILRSV